MLGRIRRVLPAYVAWVFIFYLYFVERLKYFPFDLGKLGEYLLKGNLVSHFYFVPIILQFYLLAPAIARVARKVSWAVAIPCSIVLSFAFIWISIRYSGQMMWDRVFAMHISYFVAGAYAGIHYGELEKLLAKRWKPIALASLAIAALYAGTTLAAFMKLAAVPYLVTEALQLAFRHAMIAALLAACVALAPHVKGKAKSSALFLHKCVFYVFLSHPLAMHEVMQRLPEGASMLTRFLARFLSGALAPFACAALYVLIKQMSQKIWKLRKIGASAPSGFKDGRT
jgi:peptidoglycan/LPS O-acetylase OafA/YrhL